MTDLESALTSLSKRARDYGETLATEEATKNAIVMPFIAQVLGYDVFNPAEVVPEYIADVGLKKGEKIDYAIKHGDAVHMLIEVKKVGSDLNLEHASQLVRYFHTSEARIGVLTNGREWHFYTDLDRPNVMDGRPFLQLNLDDIDSSLLPHLRKLTKQTFDLDSVIAAAEELKYVSAIKRELAAELTEPGDDFVRLFAKRVYIGSMTHKVIEQFALLTEKAAKQYINDRVNARLKSALGEQTASLEAGLTAPEAESLAAEVIEEDGGAAAVKPDVVTTDAEMEAFRIVRAIAAAVVPVDRVYLRDAKSYCAVFLDDSNRKPIARFYFDGRTKRVGVFDAEKTMSTIDIERLEDIYNQAETIRASVSNYLGATAGAN